MQTVYSSNKIPSLIIVFILGIALFASCAVLAGGLGNVADDFLDDKDAARLERLRLMEVEAQRQQVQEAEEQRLAAEAQIEIERQVAAQEVARERQMEYEVEWQRAAGDKAEADANAYSTKRAADASFAAIQRQGRLLTLSLAQQYFFGGVTSLALVAVVALTVVLFWRQK